MDELVARVRSLMRRPPSVMPLQPEFHDIRIDPQRSCMECGPEWVSLAPAELQIMLCLVRAACETVRHVQLEHAAWGLHEAVTPNALDVPLHHLRKKLALVESQIAIVNLRGVGYALILVSAKPMP